MTTNKTTNKSKTEQKENEEAKNAQNDTVDAVAKSKSAETAQAEIKFSEEQKQTEKQKMEVLSTTLQLLESDPDKKMKITRNTNVVSTLWKKKNKIRFDLPIQRQSVWKDEQKSLLIDSILKNFPIPELFILASDDGQLWVLDGGQRGRTILGFKNNEFPLLKGTDAVMLESEEVGGEAEYFDVEGKFYKELDKPVREHIDSYEIDIKEVRNATYEQIEEMFRRLNNGTPLSKIEIVRAVLGNTNMDFVNKMGESDFYSNYIMVNKNRHIDQELMIQTMMILSRNGKTGISGKEYSSFAEALRKEGISENLKNEFVSLTGYMEEAFKLFYEYKQSHKSDKTLEKMLKKSHIATMYMIARHAVQNNIDPTAFGLWAKKFIIDDVKADVEANGVSQYQVLTSKGAARKDSIEKRIDMMYKDFNATIEGIEGNLEELKKEFAPKSE